MLADFLAILGGLLVACGVAIVSIPAGLVVAGVLLVLAAWRISE